MSDEGKFVKNENQSNQISPWIEVTIPDWIAFQRRINNVINDTSERNHEIRKWIENNCSKLQNRTLVEFKAACNNEPSLYQLYLKVLELTSRKS
jgi:hypothetical protein